MLVEKITSRQNPLVKRFRRVRVGGERHLVFLEGIRLIEEALSVGAHFESVAYTSAIESSQRGLALLEALQHVHCRGAHVSQQVMGAIADTESPQGVVALIARPHYEPSDLFANPPQLIVIADELQDPGNLGAIIRTACAAGASGLLTTPGTVDPFSPKAVRASMGSALRLPIAVGCKCAELFALCRKHEVKIIAAQPPAPRPRGLPPSQIYTNVDLTAPVAILLGREAAGVRENQATQADLLVHIPMARGVESLNVAAAAAVLLYEAARQRGFKGQELIDNRQPKL
jgi:TrmH family RNA methyltransferase